MHCVKYPIQFKKSIENKCPVHMGGLTLRDIGQSHSKEADDFCLGNFSRFLIARDVWEF